MIHTMIISVKKHCNLSAGWHKLLWVCYHASLMFYHGMVTVRLYVYLHHHCWSRWPWKGPFWMECGGPLGGPRWLAGRVDGGPEKGRGRSDSNRRGSAGSERVVGRASLRWVAGVLWRTWVVRGACVLNLAAASRGAKSRLKWW
jgi:hypothetical protein